MLNLHFQHSLSDMKNFAICRSADKCKCNMTILQYQLKFVSIQSLFITRNQDLRSCSRIQDVGLWDKPNIDLARTYLHPHYGNGVFSNVSLSAGQH